MTGTIYGTIVRVFTIHDKALECKQAIGYLYCYDDGIDANGYAPV